MSGSAGITAAGCPAPVHRLSPPLPSARRAQLGIIIPNWARLSPVMKDLCTEMMGLGLPARAPPTGGRVVMTARLALGQAPEQAVANAQHVTAQRLILVDLLRDSVDTVEDRGMVAVEGLPDLGQ